MDGARDVQSHRLVVFRLLTMATAVIAVSAMAAASPVVSEDVPIPGGMAALARALGIDPPDRARCVAELARLVHLNAGVRGSRPDSTYRRLLGYFKGVDQSSPTVPAAIAAELVPIPLPAVVWSEAVFHRPVASADLFVAVMSDPSAALLAHGLAALDDETLRFLVEHPAVVTRLYERDAAVFAAFAGHLRIHNNRVVPPGGERAVPLWEGLLREKLTQPEGFVRELFAREKGRLAYLYDVIGHLDPSRAAFALGFWIEDTSVRFDRFTALALAASSSFEEWDVRKNPFARPPHDLMAMFSRIQVAAGGAPGFPASRRIWERAMAPDDLSDELVQRSKTSDEDRPVDAAWLAEVLLSGQPRSRPERLDQLAFGQRVFANADAAALPDLLVAIRALPDVRMLMLTLERMGIDRPSLYAALARQAQRVSALSGLRQRTALAQFQGAIALIARLVRVRTIDRPTADALLATLAALPFDLERGYAGALVPWLQLQLRPALALEKRDGMEGALLEALAGAPGQNPATPVFWEGQHYLFDVASSEAERLRRIRARQGGASIDAALDLHRIAQRLATGAATLDDIQKAIAGVTEQTSELSTGRIADTALEKLATIRSESVSLAATHVSGLVLDVVDVVLADALLSLSYVVDWGDPQGVARLARNVARRHDFGLEKFSHEARVRTAWAVPTATFRPGVPWHVEGAILGLDVGLASLALRRINADPLATAPAISLTERDTFVTSLALMDPFALQDATRDAIAEAVSRGRRRVETLAGGGSEVAAVVGEIAMDGWRARALRWTMTHDPQRVGSLLSMTDLLYLGGGRHLDLAPWGMSALGVLGCMCTHMYPPGRHLALVGRPHLGLLATTVADLNLRVAVTLHELKLPAALAKAVLAAALRDFVDEVKPSDADDWLTFVRTAQHVSRERIEDYVAAATSGGPLMPGPPKTPVRNP